jgi:adenylate kinase
MRASIVLLGPQLSGKGTQGAIIAERLGIPHVAAGDILRAMKTRTDPFAREVQAIMARGDRLQDADINGVMTDSLPPVAIVDGYPRSVGQAEHLDGIRDVLVAINITIPEPVSYERLAERREREGRADDTPDALANRLKHHAASSPAVEAYYARDGRLVTIDGDRPIPVVTDAVLAAIRHRLAHPGDAREHKA